MNHLKIITEDDYQLRFPVSNQKYFDSLNHNQKDNYLKVLSVYYFWLNNYVIELLGLREYDDYLKNSEHVFKEVSPENMDLYQSINKNLLNYIYVRSNVYVEKLSEQEILFIADKIKNGNLQYNETIRDFVQKTYPKVILESSIANNVSTNFGPLSERFLVQNGTLIIGVRYDEFFKDSLKSDDSWSLEYNEREQEIDFLIDLLNAKISNNNFLMKAIKYNDFSVKKKELITETNAIKK